MQETIKTYSAHFSTVFNFYKKLKHKAD